MSDLGVPTPELDRMLAIADESQSIGRFIDWLHEEKHLHICEWSDAEYADGRLVPGPSDPARLLAEYFNIDLNKVERERRAILDALRERNT